MRKRILLSLLTVFLALLPYDPVPYYNAVTAAGTTSLFLPIVAKAGSPTLTTYQLIDQAVNNGDLDVETGLIFKVYADFNDPRLPGRYKGNDINPLEGSGLSNALGQWNSLSAAAQATLQPFFVPPIYSGSWFNQAAATKLTSATQTTLAQSSSGPQPPDCGAINSGWVWQDAASVPVRFWGSPDQAGLLVSFANEVDSKIWGDLSTLFGDLPLPDTNSACNGGSSRLNVYLVKLGRSYTISVNDDCSQTPAYILFDPVAYSAELFENMAHELAHAFQFAYKVTSCSDTDWIREATATFAQQHVYPLTQSEQRTAPWYLDYPLGSLNYVNDSFEYGAYMFFFYLSLSDSPGVVAQVWQSLASQTSLDALDAAISGGFKQHWPEFALWNLNSDPFLEYQQADSLQIQIRLALDGYVIVPGKDLTSQDIAPSQLDYLSQFQVHQKFSDPKARTVFIYNGWSFNLAPAPWPGLPAGNLAYTPAAIPSDQMNGRSLWIVPKVQGSWLTEDITNTGLKVFCLDEASERPSELYLVHTNYLKSGTLTPPGQLTTLFATNIGCWHWQGSVDYSDSAFEMHATNLLWERSTPLENQISYKLVSGALTWTIVVPGCTGQGSFNLATDQGTGTIMSTYNNLISGSIYRRFFVHGDLANPMVNVVCSGVPAQVQLPYWGDSNLNDPSSLFQDDGTINNTFTPGGAASWHWQLTPLADP